MRDNLKFIERSYKYKTWRKRAYERIYLIEGKIEGKIISKL